MHIPRIDPLPARPYRPGELTAKLNELIRAHNELEYHLESLVESCGRMLLCLDRAQEGVLRPLFDKTPTATG
ncbi:MAG: hypothetical protein GKR89_33170 [Candidatus Latescibacteria bacterium]|nr:hypothetical protein [Candidatus Latescibacterota bacterium]